MADKTTTLKTKTGDNVYPNIKGENRKDSFVDSSTITHHFYDQTHKVGFQIANETNIKIQNSLQKPAGLTKTKLVGVGTNGQENIEIGDNLTLANGKLSAVSGGDNSAIKTITLSKTYDNSINYIDITDDESDFIKTNFPVNIIVKFSNGLNILLTPAYSAMSGGKPDIYFIVNDATAISHGEITQVKMCYISYYNNPKTIYIKNLKNIELDTSLEKKHTNNSIGGFYEWGDMNVYKLKVTNPLPNVPTDKTESYYLYSAYDSATRQKTIAWNVLKKTYNHFITLTNNTSTFYFTYQNTSNEKLNTLDSLKTALAGKYLLCTGHTDSDTAEYISGERGNIVVGVVDNSDHSTSGITIDSSFIISDSVSPVE